MTLTCWSVSEDAGVDVLEDQAGEGHSEDGRDGGGGAVDLGFMERTFIFRFSIVAAVGKDFVVVDAEKLFGGERVCALHSFPKSRA